MPIRKEPVRRKNPYDRAPNPRRDLGPEPGFKKEKINTKHGIGNLHVEVIGDGPNRLHIRGEGFHLKIDGIDEIHNDLIAHGIDPTKLSKSTFNKLFNR